MGLKEWKALGRTERAADAAPMLQAAEEEAGGWRKKRQMEQMAEQADWRRMERRTAEGEQMARARKEKALMRAGKLWLRRFRAWPQHSRQDACPALSRVFQKGRKPLGLPAGRGLKRMGALEWNLMLMAGPARLLLMAEEGAGGWMEEYKLAGRPSSMKAWKKAWKMEEDGKKLEQAARGPMVQKSERPAACRKAS
jgi:hypothetical protein